MVRLLLFPGPVIGDLIKKRGVSPQTIQVLQRGRSIRIVPSVVFWSGVGVYIAVAGGYAAHSSYLLLLYILDNQC